MSNEIESQFEAPLGKRDELAGSANPNHPLPFSKKKALRPLSHQPPPASPPLPFDLWGLLGSTFRFWPWLIGIAVLMALLGLWLGLKLFQTQYTAQAQSIHYETSFPSDFFKPRSFSPQTLASLMRSPELLQRVGSQANPPISAEALAASLNVSSERNSEVITVALTGTDAQQTVDLVNLHSREAILFSKEMQAEEAGKTLGFLKQQIEQVERKIQGLDRELVSLSQELQLLPHASLNPLSLQQAAPMSVQEESRLTEQLHIARGELFTLLAHYTEAHPLVQRQHAKLAAIQKQMAEIAEAPDGVRLGDPKLQLAGDPSHAETHINGFSEQESRHALVRAQLQELATDHWVLASRQKAVESFMKDPPGYYRLFVPATLQTVTSQNRWFHVAFVTMASSILGVVLAIGMILVGESLDERLKSSTDVRRVTRLPLLATLGNLRAMKAPARAAWAFHTWTYLQNRLRPSSQHGWICGVTSSTPGEGVSTWIELLADAASQRGFRVLVIQTDPPPPKGASPVLSRDYIPLTTEILAEPNQISERLMMPNSRVHLHISFPSWIWNLERRRQWWAALLHWKSLDHVTIFIELPPAQQPESILLAEHIPNVIWLSRCRISKSKQSRTQLELWRKAHCHLIGAVFNHEPPTPKHPILHRWLWSLGLFFGLAFGHFSEPLRLPSFSLPFVGCALLDVCSIDQTKADFHRISP